MRAKQSTVKGMRIVLATALGMFLLLSANQARAVLLFWADGGGLADYSDGKYEGESDVLGLPRIAGEAVEVRSGWRSGSGVGSLTGSPGTPLFAGQGDQWHQKGGVLGGTSEVVDDFGMPSDYLGLETVRKVPSVSPVDPVPEPASLMLLGTGLLALAAGRTWRSRKT